MIAIVEGCGANIASVQYAIERLGHQSTLTSDPAIIRSASHVILPGVGSAKRAMQKLQERRLCEVIRQLTQPVLGICLGMQLMYQFSQEGEVECLCLLPGEIKKLAGNLSLTIPHMGWNQLQVRDDTCLLNGIKDESYVYFVHSYVAPLSKHTLGITKHGDEFSAVIKQENFYGVQFHPERSGKIGEQIIINFLTIK